MSGESKILIGMFGAYVGAIALGMLFSVPFKGANLQAFSEPENPANTLFYFGVIIGVTVFFLVLIKLKKQLTIKYIFMLAIASTLFFLLPIMFWYFLPYSIDIAELIGVRTGISLYLDIPFTLGISFAYVALTLLIIYPEWYVVNSVGFVSAAGIIALMGISLGIIPSIILLVGLAVYDAISVYKTKHMITLAESVTELQLPVLMVFPKSADYKFTEQKPLKETLAKKTEEREAMFMGLGDIIIPGTLVVSSYINITEKPLVGLLTTNLVTALLTLTGSLIGFFVLTQIAKSGKPQAGLPFLNFGALAGFLIGYVLTI